MKRLDVNITDYVNDALDELKRGTERSRTELVHDSVALLVWAAEVSARGHSVAEVDPSDNRVLMRFSTPMFEGIRAAENGIQRFYGREPEADGEPSASVRQR